ncbi:hypothetical protein QJQ45_011358 [Haematococcus lacustris]|nr:hypothetical protein QJQ45_011358 [Haematococcus lacustris]
MPSVMGKEELSKLTNAVREEAELKTQLKELGLPQAGKKEELVERILSAQNTSDTEAAQAMPPAVAPDASEPGPSAAEPVIEASKAGAQLPAEAEAATVVKEQHEEGSAAVKGHAKIVFSEQAAKTMPDLKKLVVVKPAEAPKAEHIKLKERADRFKDPDVEKSKQRALRFGLVGMLRCHACSAHPEIEKEKTMKRAERFGTFHPELDAEKKKAREARFGKEAFKDVTKEEDPATKAAARAERFKPLTGSTIAAPSADGSNTFEAMKKARAARFATAAAKLSKKKRQHLQELNASPKAGFKCCPNGLKAQKKKAQVEAMKLRAQVEQLHQQLGDAVADYQLLQADMEQLQAAHQEVQGENESLEQLAEERTHAIQMLQQDKRRLSLALRNVRRCRVSGPRLTRHQRQLMNILMRHQVSPEVLQRCAEGGYGIPSGTAAQQPCPSPDPPAFTTNFIPTQVGRCGKPAARTAAYLAQHYLSTARLVLQTQDSVLLLKIAVVAVVGQTYLMPELLWASKVDGLHAFELYRHIQQVCKGLQQPWANNAQLLSQLHSKLQQLVPADQREHQKQQLATYLQQHCAAMEEYYTQHCKRQLDMPHLMAALGGSDPQSCKEVAAKVVKCVALLMNDGQTDLGVWDPHSTWHQFSQDIQAMAEGSPCSTRLRLHLEVYFLACPTSNAPVESLLQLLKHGAGRFMELPALLEHMSLHTLRTTLNSVDVHDFTLQMPKLRTAVRLEEVAAASASAPARAARKATAAACCVGGVVVNVGDHASQQRVAAAAAAAGCSQVCRQVPGVPPPQPPLPPQPPPHQPPQQQGRSSWGTALEGQMLAPPIASPQGPIASPDLRHMYQLALAAIATQGQAAPAQGSELGAATPAPGFTLRKRTTPSEGLPKTAAKRKG